VLHLNREKMKSIGQLPYKTIAPELERIASYHKLQLNHVSEYKIALVIFSNLYYNAPWESMEDADEHNSIYENKTITKNNVNPANRYIGLYAKLLQKFKSSWLRCIFIKRKRK
jgi:hypothetical protein